MCRKTTSERMTCTQTLRSLCPALCWAPALHHLVGPELAWRRTALKTHHILSPYGPGTSPYSSICTRSMDAFQRSVPLQRRPAITSIEASVPDISDDIIVKLACLWLFWCLAGTDISFRNRKCGCKSGLYSCLQHCSSDGPEGPTGFLERLCFEMKKGYKETMLQLVLSPLHVFVSDNYQVGVGGSDPFHILSGAGI